MWSVGSWVVLRAFVVANLYKVSVIRLPQEGTLQRCVLGVLATRVSEKLDPACWVSKGSRKTIRKPPTAGFPFL